MKPAFLFPYWFRYLGWSLVILHVPVAALDHHIGWDQHLFFISTTLLMSLGLFFVAFAKERIEDEQIWQLRLHSLRWAIYVNYLILILGLFFINDTFHILQLNLWVPLLFFIIRFRWAIYTLNRDLNRTA